MLRPAPSLFARGALVLALVAAPMAHSTTAHARAEVVIGEVRLPEGQDPKKAKLVRRLLAAAAKRAQFGKAKKVQVEARVTELSVERQGDVLKVRCAMVGRLAGGASVRSRIEFGGRPDERTALEREVVGMVADGLMTRLAQMARERAAKEAPDPPPDRR